MRTLEGLVIGLIKDLFRSWGLFNFRKSLWLNPEDEKPIEASKIYIFLER